jgi:hypothetical protein
MRTPRKNIVLACEARVFSPRDILFELDERARRVRGSNPPMRRRILFTSDFLSPSAAPNIPFRCETEYCRRKILIRTINVQDIITLLFCKKELTDSQFCDIIISPKH